MKPGVRFQTCTGRSALRLLSCEKKTEILFWKPSRQAELCSRLRPTINPLQPSFLSYWAANFHQGLCAGPFSRCQVFRHFWSCQLFRPAEAPLFIPLSGARLQTRLCVLSVSPASRCG